MAKSQADLHDEMIERAEQLSMVLSTYPFKTALDDEAVLEDVCIQLSKNNEALTDALAIRTEKRKKIKPE